MDLDLPVIFRDLMVSRYLALTAITVYFYDCILVFNDEIELLGAARFSKGKILYCFARIATPIGLFLGVFHLVELRPNLNNAVCIAFIWVSTILEVVSIFASYWLLTLRLIALYKSKPVIVYLIYISLFGAYSASLGLLIQVLRQFAYTTVYLPSINVCIPLGRPPSIQGVFETALFFEVLLFALTAWHAWRAYLEQRVGRVHVRTAPLLKIMYRDGIFYFCAMVGLRVWNTVIYATRPIYEMFIGLYIMWSLITILSCRIYLNIAREAQGKRPFYEDDTQSRSTGQGHSLRRLARA